MRKITAWPIYWKIVNENKGVHSEIVHSRDYCRTIPNTLLASSLPVCCNLSSVFFVLSFFFFWINVYFYTKPKIQDYYFNIVITAMIIISDVTKQQHWRSECWMSLVCVQIFYFSGVVWAFYCQNKKKKQNQKKK